jgi:hypothetical protein
MNNQFEFNIQKLFGPLAKLLPIGIGSTGYSNLNFDVSVDLSLVTEFKPNGGISISLGPNFGIEASVGYSFVDSVRVCHKQEIMIYIFYSLILFSFIGEKF